MITYILLQENQVETCTLLLGIIFVAATPNGIFWHHAQWNGDEN